MTRQLSFSKQENELRGGFREMMDHAESTQDVKKFFYQTVRELLDRATGKSLDARFEEVSLDLDRGEGFALAAPLRQRGELDELMKKSDLDNILSRLADQAWNRYRHLDKNPEKTEKKMWKRPTER